MEIYERLFLLLQEKGISQKKLSELTGIPQSTISDWKNKRVNPSADKIMPICNAINITPYDLLCDTGEKYMSVDFAVIGKNSDEYKLIEIYKSLDQRTKSRIIGYAEALKK